MSNNDSSLKPIFNERFFLSCASYLNLAEFCKIKNNQSVEIIKFNTNREKLNFDTLEKEIKNFLNQNFLFLILNISFIKNDNELCFIFKFEYVLDVVESNKNLSFKIFQPKFLENENIVKIEFYRDEFRFYDKSFSI